MSFINPREKEINCKIVYFGPALSGKSTTLRKIYEKISADKSGKIVSLTAETDRTIYFDFLPLSLGKVNGFTIRLHLYSVPGQVLYANSRKIILKGTDGVVFVADSQVSKMEANLQSLESLKKNLQEQEVDFNKLPFVFQYNKRDIPQAAPLAQLREILNLRRAPDFESVATKGTGVMEGMQAIAKQVLKELQKKE
ncbi:MAG: ADP-ribosylation factor-like protein [Deltaproteobacteria bacterium]|nr:ADP-ribosylation factor-like protein [Deltaproteobacteria bacterium]